MKVIRSMIFGAMAIFIFAGPVGADDPPGPAKAKASQAQTPDPRKPPDIKLKSNEHPVDFVGTAIGEPTAAPGKDPSGQKPPAKKIDKPR